MQESRDMIPKCYSGKGDRSALAIQQKDIRYFETEVLI